MLSPAETSEIQQKRMDALSAKYLHENRLSKLTWLNTSVDWLAIGVPIIYFAIRFLAKGTSYETLVDIVWEILAALLIVLAFSKIVWKTQESAEKHSKLIGENILLGSQAKHLLDGAAAANPGEAYMFVALADSLESRDRESLGPVSNKDRQWAYREALKEFSSGSTQLCPSCGADPWKFVPGACQVCGGTPISSSLVTT